MCELVKTSIKIFKDDIVFLHNHPKYNLSGLIQETISDLKKREGPSAKTKDQPGTEPSEVDST